MSNKMKRRIRNRILKGITAANGICAMILAAALRPDSPVWQQLLLLINLGWIWLFCEANGDRL